jgi:hypothetical protein
MRDAFGVGRGDGMCHGDGKLQQFVETQAAFWKRERQRATFDQLHR